MLRDTNLFNLVYDSKYNRFVVWKMLISLTLPFVSSKELLYTFRDSRDIVRVYIGYRHTDGYEILNIENSYELRKWYLRDRRNIIVQRGELQVKLGTFESYVDLSNLVSGEVYTFFVENPEIESENLRESTIISGIRASDIILIDETFRFVGNPITIGDIICTLIDPDGSLFSERQARFTQNWNIERTVGNGLIFSGGKIYAFAPTAIYTRNRNASKFIDFTPYTDLPVKRIPVHQLPTIHFNGNYTYTINPPTRIIATWKNINGSYETYDSINIISLLELTNITKEGIQNLRIKAIF
jgi:hypothetical protein